MTLPLSAPETRDGVRALYEHAAGATWRRPQAYLPKSPLIAQFKKECLDFVPSEAANRIPSSVEFPGVLAHVLVPVDLQRAVVDDVHAGLCKQFRHCEGFASNVKPCVPRLMPV